MDHPVLKQIGAFRLKKHLAASGPVQVYLAEEEGPSQLPREVVLKIVQPESTDDAQADEMIRQAPLICKLVHPGLIRAYRFFMHEKALVLVLEYANAVSLAELLEMRREKGRQALSDTAALFVALSILDALAYVHRASNAPSTTTPLVHKAVSPSNVYVRQDGTIKLGGFGFVKPFGIVTDPAGKLQWKSAHMAPEQIEGQVPTPKVDVYAAGLILWELLSGQPPRKPPQNALAIDQASAGPEPLGSLRSDLAPELLAIVDAALAPTPEKRVIGCSEMAQRIRKMYHDGRGKNELKAWMAAAPSTQGPQVAVPRKPLPNSRTLSGVAPPAPKPAQAARPAVVPPPPRRPKIPLPAPLITMPILDVGDEPAPKAEVAAPSNDPAMVASSRIVDVSGPAGLPPEEPGTVPARPYEIEADYRVAMLAVSTPIVERSSIGAVARPIIERTSIVDQLRAPTRWRRRTTLGVWSALLVVLFVMVVKLSTGRSGSPASSVAAAPTASIAALEPSTPQPAAEPVAEPLAADPESTSPPDDVPDPSLPPGFGYITVHSSSSAAAVYVKLRRAGALDEKLAVPCGQQFLSIGILARGKKEPTWLAPGKMVDIPCGGSTEVTLEPRALR
jgi:serine/threonine protein kinase